MIKLSDGWIGLAEVHWYEAHGIGRRKLKKTVLGMTVNMAKRNYVVCIKAEALSDIEVRKIYEVVPDDLAGRRKYLRVVDESGEDYLYPEACFSPIQLPEKAIRVLVSLSATPRATTSQPPSRARKASAHTVKRVRAPRG